MDDYFILVINPGSTSTKLAIFNNQEQILKKTIRHSVDDLKGFEKMADQIDFRTKVILDFLNENQVNDLDAVIGRGGILKPIPSGIYKVNEIMCNTLKEAKYGEHASNLGALIANHISIKFDIPAYIADPVVVDEMHDIARISGYPDFERKSIFHALNHKAVAKEIAKQIGKNYEDCNFVIAHLGGGISVGAHKKGKIVDVNNALAGEGAFSPERSGTVPSGQLVQMCFSGKYTEKEICKKLVGKGGITAYLGTNNMIEVEQRVKNGDKQAVLVLEAMAYQVSKEIGAYSVVLNGEIDAIILTGGIAYDEHFVNYIKNKVAFLSSVIVYPGEDELKALAQMVYSVQTGEEKAKDYV